MKAVSKSKWGTLKAASLDGYTENQVILVRIAGGWIYRVKPS